MENSEKTKPALPFAYHLHDLTHTLTPTMPSWSGACGFESTIKLDYKTESGDVSFRVQQLKMHAGIGTHMDAPAHCIPGGATIAELALSNFLAPCVVIDVSAQAEDARYTLEPSTLRAFEAAHGAIPHGALVLVHTGWERWWHTPERYRNHYMFPKISGEAAAYLLERRIVGLGIDTLSPDRPAEGFPVHAQLLGAGKYIIENITNALALPPTGAYALALPIKATGCTEAPIRLVGLQGL